MYQLHTCFINFSPSLKVQEQDRKEMIDQLHAHKVTGAYT